MKSNKVKAYERGLIAEKLTEAHLMCKGCKVLARRYKTPMGEIDLVALKGDMLLFVEVKARASHAQALEAVHSRSQERIMNAALHFISQYPQYADYAMRFDVAAFEPPFRLHYLDNAWQSPT